MALFSVKNENENAGKPSSVTEIKGPEIILRRPEDLVEQSAGVEEGNLLNEGARAQETANQAVERIESGRPVSNKLAEQALQTAKASSDKFDPAKAELLRKFLNGELPISGNESEVAKKAMGLE